MQLLTFYSSLQNYLQMKEMGSLLWDTVLLLYPTRHSEVLKYAHCRYAVKEHKLKCTMSFSQCSQRNKVALILCCSILLSLSLGNFKLLYLSKKGSTLGFNVLGFRHNHDSEIPYIRGNLIIMPLLTYSDH